MLHIICMYNNKRWGGGKGIWILKFPYSPFRLIMYFCFKTKYNYLYQFQQPNNSFKLVFSIWIFNNDINTCFYSHVLEIIFITWLIIWRLYIIAFSLINFLFVTSKTKPLICSRNYFQNTKSTNYALMKERNSGKCVHKNAILRSHEQAKQKINW